MKWLVMTTLASLAGAAAAVRLFELVLGEVAGASAAVVKPGLFIGVGAAIAHSRGMRGFERCMRWLRKKVGSE